MTNVSTSMRRIQAFTLTELLVVIAIVGILAALFLPAAGSMKDRANQAQCISNLRQLGVGIQIYAAENRNELPIYLTKHVPDTLSPSWWHRRIQGYLDSQFGTTATKPFICPSDPAPYNSALSYAMNYNLSGQHFSTIQAKLILLTEVSAISTTGNSTDISALKYNHSNGKTIDVLFADGSVKSMTSVPDSAANPSLWIP